jgi:hypothetical protein
LSFFVKTLRQRCSQNDPYPFLVPTDYLASFSLSITNSSSKEFLLQKDVNFIQEYNPNPATTGVPKYYAFFDVNNFIVAPTPNSNYAVSFITIINLTH